MRRVKHHEGAVTVHKKRKAESPSVPQQEKKSALSKNEFKRTLADLENKLANSKVLGRKPYSIAEKPAVSKGLSYKSVNGLNLPANGKLVSTKTDIFKTEVSRKKEVDGAVPTKKISVSTRLSLAKTTLKKFESTSTKTVSVESENVSRLPKPKVSERVSVKPSIQAKAASRSSSAKIKDVQDKTSIVTIPRLTGDKVTEPEVGTSTGPITRAQARKSALEESAGDSVYHSAVEDISSGGTNSPNTIEKSAVKEVAARRRESLRKPPPGVPDFDILESHDIFSVSTYAFDVFEYLKSRESAFKIPDYMKSQTCITSSMRAVLVDWLVEIQEGFELYHETLYLAVKLLDTYLSKSYLLKSKLQLLGCACMLIASKFEEKIPLSSSDLIECSNKCFNANELFSMELKVLKATNYNLGFPLSYVFVRRYTRCCGSNAIIKSLVRYILEMSLMDYSLVTVSDSKLAAAAVYLAHMMNNIEPWNETLEYYSGYKAVEILDLVHGLNACLHKKSRNGIHKIHTKYSHETFGEVTKIPLIPLLSTKLLASKFKQTSPKVLPRD